VVGKKAGCPIFIIPDDGPGTFQSIIPQNNATFVSSSPAADFSTFLFNNATPAPSSVPSLSSLSPPSSPTPVHMKGVPTNTPTITPLPSIPTPTPTLKPTTSKPAPDPSTQSIQPLFTPTKEEPTAKPPSSPTTTVAKQQPTIYSLDQSFIPPSMFAALQSANSTNSTTIPISSPPVKLPTTVTSPRQTPEKELESLKKSLVLDVVNFHPESESNGANTKNTKEKGDLIQSTFK